VIVAAGSGGDAEKNSIEKKGHSRFLGQKPGMTDDSQNYVSQDDDTETGDGDSAEDHQQIFKRIEGSPLEMALLLQDQAVEAHRHFPKMTQE